VVKERANVKANVKSRLRKLSALTQGAAVVGLGVSTAACTRTDPAPQAQTASGVSADNAADGDAGAGPDASPFAFRRRLPVPNAAPQHRLRFRHPDAGGPPDTEDSDGGGP
jgi:hypothetical protein